MVIIQRFKVIMLGEYKKAQIKKISVIFTFLLFFSLVFVFAIPLITHEDNPLNGTVTSNKSIELNFNITEANLKEVKFNWNSTNYSLFDKDLVLMYNFNNLSSLGENSTHVFDISGNGNDGTVTGASFNSSARDNGNYGGAFEFDGINDRINLSNFNKQFIGNESGWTIDLWVNIKSFPISSAIEGENIISKGFTQRIHILTNTSTTYGRVSFIARGEAEGDVSYVESNLNDSRFHNFIFMWDSSGDRLYVYVDGIMKSNKTMIDMKQNSDDLNSTYWLGYSDRVARYFNGTIDEVRIWNKSFNGEEVQQLC